MSVDNKPSPQLFARVLGDSWQQLAPELRRFHTYEELLTSRGTFQVRHGRWPASWLAWMMDLPAAGDSVDLRLKVTEVAGVERWERSFAGKLMTTFQSHRADGLLVEQVGRMEIYFHLEVRDAAMHFQTVGAALRCGPWRLLLPAWLRPRITACESYDVARAEIGVRVEICLPLWGTVIEYGGTLQPNKGTLQQCRTNGQACGVTA